VACGLLVMDEFVTELKVPLRYFQVGVTAEGARTSGACCVPIADVVTSDLYSSMLVVLVCECGRIVEASEVNGSED
jgi:hypothetical protein